MAREIFQKPIGWLQRFLFNVERGDIPFPQPVIEIGQDWPLQYTRFNTTYATIIGTVNTTVYAPGNEKHGLIFLMSVSKVAAGNFGAADLVLVTMALPDGTGVPLVQYNNGPLDLMPIIGTKLTAVNGIGSIDHLWGIDPLYVPPGASVSVAHVSAVGGDTAQVIGVVVERLKSYPLRLP